MSDLVWILWAVLGVVLVIAEIFTSGFVLFWFGLGALAAALLALLGVGAPLQFLAFIVVSSLLTALSRTILQDYFGGKEAAGVRLGAASLPGQVGTVVSESRGALQEGAVKVYGSVWTAFPAEGEPPLREGERVVVESLRGASIYVRRAGTLPDWRAKELPGAGGDDR